MMFCAYRPMVSMICRARNTVEPARNTKINSRTAMPTLMLDRRRTPLSSPATIETTATAVSAVMMRTFGSTASATPNSSLRPALIWEVPRPHRAHPDGQLVPVDEVGHRQAGQREDRPGVQAQVV